MKLSKKALVTVFLLTVCFAAVFAQSTYTPDLNLANIRISPESMTSTSTGLFGTDVDDYLDVNEWSNVKPQKLFGFLSYGPTGVGANNLNTGFAAPVGKFYLGGFFGGQLNGWTSTKTTTKNSKGSNSTTTGTPNTASGSILFGFDNIGVMGNITYAPGSPNSTTTNSLTNTTTTNNNFSLETALKAGMNIKGPKDIVFKTSAELALTSKVNKTTSKVGSSPRDLISDTSKYTLRLNGGVGFDFAHNGPVTQGANFALNTAWNIYPTVTYDVNSTKMKNETHGQLHDTLTLDSAWQITYEPEGSKVAVKAKVGVPVAFSFDKNEDYAKNTTGGITKTKYTDRVSTTRINFAPTLKVGLTYAPIAKFRFNLGSELTLPTFAWEIETIKHRDSDNGLLTSAGTDKTVAWNFITASTKVKVGTGFTWFITQDIIMDAYWKLGENLLKGFGTTGVLKEGHTNFWDNVNKLLIHDIGFLLSVKL